LTRHFNGELVDLAFQLADSVGQTFDGLFQLAELVGGDFFLAAISIHFWSRIRLGVRLGIQLGADACELFTKTGESPVQQLELFFVHFLILGGAGRGLFDWFAMAGHQAEKLGHEAIRLFVLGQLEHGEIQRFAGADSLPLVALAELEVGGAGAGWLVGNAQPNQVGATQIGELLERLDGAELILAALVPVDEIPIRAEDGEQLELAVYLFGLECLHGAIAGPAIVIRPDDGGVIGRVVGLGHVGEPFTGDIPPVHRFSFGGDTDPASSQG